MPLNYWSLEDYERQWAAGIKRLRTKNRSCLVVSIYNPTTGNFIEWWALYKIKNKVYIRNQILVSDIYKKRIGNKTVTVNNCYNFIAPRAGKKVSEWVVDYL